jgi:hypothetical protein
MIEAWHFVGSTLRDGRPIPPDGEWLVHTGPVKICSTGLHASRRPAHALEYAPGPVLCRVECDDIVTEDDDKFVCRRRRIIQRADITETLRYYARMQALSVIHLYDDPPDVVLDYLMTGDESIRDAAWDAAWAAAGVAARDAAWAAAWDAAWAAAGVAARDAAWAAAWDAAWDAARDAARDNFDALIYEQFDVPATAPQEK